MARDVRFRLAPELDPEEHSYPTAEECYDLEREAERERAARYRRWLVDERARRRAEERKEER